LRLSRFVKIVLGWIVAALSFFLTFSIKIELLDLFCCVCGFFFLNIFVRRKKEEKKPRLNTFFVPFQKDRASIPVYFVTPAF